MSLLIQNIQKSYGTKQVLKNGSLLAPKGSVTALIGKNGVGKTTTFKIVCGLISAEGGEVLWNETKMHPTSMEWKKRIGYLPEHNPLYKDMYLREFLSLACQIHQVKNPSERITEVIELVGLGEYTNFKINHLSKGYRQRVGLAQAIINDPEVIILDEPTSGLDPSQLVEVRALIKSLAKNKTVILSSHILSEVEQICDRIYMIQNGTITSLDDMKNDNIWLVRFDAEVRPKWFESVGEVINASSHLVEIEIKKESDKGEIFDIAVQNQVRITEMRAKERALESVFLDEQRGI